ncbi:MAG: helix-turn-helix domain-containing protein [Pseudomonadota bacterium]
MEKSRVIEGLGALAQETRLDIVRFLVRKGPVGAPAGRIGQQFGLPSATLAFHLNTLTAAGLLTRERAGRQNIYRADFGAVHALTAYLLQNCCSETEPAEAGQDTAA